MLIFRKDNAMNNDQTEMHILDAKEYIVKYIEAMINITKPLEDDHEK